MATGPPITQEEIEQVLAHDVPSDVKMGARMPRWFLKFHQAEATWAYMLEMGLIDKALYDKGTQGRFSFKQWMPAASVQDVVKALGEERNATPRLAMISQSAGAKKLGDKLVAIRKSDVPGMDARSITELIREPLVREELSGQALLEIVETLATKKREEGAFDDEEAQETIDAARKLRNMLKRAGVL